MIQANTVFKNRILNLLPQSELEMLLPHLEPVELEQRKMLYDIGQKCEYIYFIEHGISSILSTMENGTSIEVGMVGFEGLTPIGMLFGEETSEHQNIIQLPGNGYRISLLHCRSVFEKATIFRKIVLKFANSLYNLGTQTAACNRLQSTEQRFSRWLLMSQDRFESDILPLTQEYISAMLGVRRAGITEAAGELQRSSLIHYNRGLIRIIDRAGLEKYACECYVTDYERFITLIQ